MNHTSPPAARTAVLIPCYNEEAAIADVVEEFKRSLPGAVIYVYDNNSTDRTREVATTAGAIVCSEFRQGKGNVVRRMMNEVDADVYILVDGDGTYDASTAPAMVNALVEDHLAMVVGRRIAAGSESYSRSRVLGNWLFTHAVAAIFDNTFADVLSGYRAFSRGFVKSFSAESQGFEIEVELAVHTITLDLPVREIDTVYKARAEGSQSKLHPYRDGWRILKAVLKLFRKERPMIFYSLIGCSLALASILLAVPHVASYLRTGLAPRLSTSVVIAGIAASALFSFVCGLVLDSMTRRRREAKKSAYLGEMEPLRLHNP